MTTTTLVTIGEAARRLSVSRSTIERHIRDGELGTINVGKGTLRPHIRLIEGELEDFVARRYQKQPQTFDGTFSAKLDDTVEEYDILTM